MCEPSARVLCAAALDTRARIGAAMMGPDYAWWHGAHEAKSRYMELWDEYQRLLKLGRPDPVPYLPGAPYEKGPNLRPGIDVPDLRENKGP